jgi:hypothetical protein
MKQHCIYETLLITRLTACIASEGIDGRFGTSGLICRPWIEYLTIINPFLFALDLFL